LTQKVGEKRDLGLEAAGNGFYEIPLRWKRIKPEPGLAPGPAEPEAGPVPAPAPKKPRAKPAKCAHGKRRSSCKECGGASICVHGRRRSRCKECGGASICVHGRHRSGCKECGVYYRYSVP
jgi:hypothetical protein